jgi:hypothetical protein
MTNKNKIFIDKKKRWEKFQMNSNIIDDIIINIRFSTWIPSFSNDYNDLFVIFVI